MILTVLLKAFKNIFVYFSTDFEPMYFRISCWNNFIQYVF